MFYNQVRESSPGLYGQEFNFDTRALQSFKAKERCKTEEGKNNLKKAAKAACEAPGRNSKISNTLKEEYEDGTIKAYWTGKTHTEETKQRMSKSHEGHETSNETRKKLSNANTGRKYIHKDGKRKFVKPEEIEQYISEGWELGWHV